MKKIFFSFLAIAAIASCAKTADVFTEDGAEIKLAPVTKLQTKANYLGAVDGTTYPTQENFDVYAYWKNVVAGQEFIDGSIFLQSLDEGGAEFTNKGNYWGGIDKYYWPKNGSLRFAAYSPAHLTVDHQQDGDLYTVAYEQPSNTAETWDFLVAPTSPSYSMMTAAENVAIEFQHALSWITLKVVAKDADAAKAFDIKKVTINDVCTKANFAAKMGDGIQYEEWMGQNTKTPYVVFEGAQMVTETVTDIENTVAGTLVIPQPTTTVTIDFDQYGINGTADTPGMTVTLDLVLDTDNTPWEPGKHYNYTLIFGLDEILINPSVVDWEEIIVGEIDVDASNVSTEAQLEAALAKGGKVTLQDNIALSTGKTLNVVAGKTVVLDLNGKTLSGNSAQAGNYDMFLVKGELTVNNGTVTTVSTVNNGWGSMTTIFDITAGGMVSLNNVEAINQGGTDMAFVAHLNNWGEVTLNADNSYLESNYVAVRVFNSGYDMNNVSIYNSTLKGGSNAFWVHNYTVADFGSEAKAASQQALLNFDIFNGTNTFVGAKPYTPIRYGMTNSLFLDAEGNVAGNAVAVSTAAELQDALNAAKSTVEVNTIYFAADIAGDVIATQKEGVNVVINGNGYEWDGALEVYGAARNDGAETLTIKNVVFNSTTAKDYILCNTAESAKRYAHNVTVDGCTFKGAAGCVGMRFRQCYNITFKNCVVDGIHSLIQNTGCHNQVIENCQINAGSGLNFLTSADKVVVANCQINSTKADGYGIRVDAAAGNVLEVRNSTVAAYNPIALRKCQATYELKVYSSTLTDACGYQVYVEGTKPVLQGQEVTCNL